MSRTDGLGLEDLQRFWQVCPDLFALLDAQGAFVECNDAWSRRLDWTPATLHGRHLRELTHLDDHEALDAALARLRRFATTVELDLRIRSHDGPDLEVQGALHSVMGASGREPTIHLTTRDVTEQRRAEAALVTTSEQLHLAMGAAPIGMVLADLEGRAQLVNDAMCRFLGRTRDELLGLRLDEVAHPQDREAAQTNLARMLAEDREAHRFDLRFAGSADRVVHGEVTACVVRDVEDDPVYILGQIVDVTHHHVAETRLRTTVAELEDSNHRLEQANEMLEHFAAIASHDLRAPLATVHTVLDTVLLRSAAPLAGRDRDLLDRARRHTSALVETIDALLTLATHRVEHQATRPVALGDLVAEVLDAMGPELQRSQASVEAVDLPTVTGDPAMLRVLVQNLLANAIKFAHPDRHPHVRVTARALGDSWELSVTDNGVGLTADQAERIFERFVRTGDVHAQAGSGLGLATCRQIAEAHGGDIRAEPLPVGARFVVRLPATAG